MTAAPDCHDVLVLSTMGAGSRDEARICELLRDFSPEVFPFDRSHKFRSSRRLFQRLRSKPPRLVVMEGTGIGGGLPLLWRRLFGRISYVVSSGDAVGPWVGSRHRPLGPLFGMYERLLYRWSAGFIGWTPYLVGRALTFGAPRAMTAAGWAPYRRTPEEQATARQRVRGALGIPERHIVVGIAGSMVWSQRHGYCYGLELVKAAHRIRRSDVTFLLVGSGDGKPRLERLAADLPPGRVIFTGQVSQDVLPDYYAAMDIGSLPQSVDQVGSFRYTTKISEYAASGLPLTTGQIPLAYDLDTGWIFRLAGATPWSDVYLDELAGLLEGLTAEQLQAKRDAVPRVLADFDCDLQVARVGSFVADILSDVDRSKA